MDGVEYSFRRRHGHRRDGAVRLRAGLSPSRVSNRQSRSAEVFLTGGTGSRQGAHAWLGGSAGALWKMRISNFELRNANSVLESLMSRIETIFEFDLLYINSKFAFRNSK